MPNIYLFEVNDPVPEGYTLVDVGPWEAYLLPLAEDELDAGRNCIKHKTTAAGMFNLYSGMGEIGGDWEIVEGELVEDEPEPSRWIYQLKLLTTADEPISGVSFIFFSRKVKNRHGTYQVLTSDTGGAEVRETQDDGVLIFDSSVDYGTIEAKVTHYSWIRDGRYSIPRVTILKPGAPVVVKLRVDETYQYNVTVLAPDGSPYANKKFGTNYKTPSYDINTDGEGRAIISTKVDSIKTIAHTVELDKVNQQDIVMPVMTLYPGENTIKLYYKEFAEVEKPKPKPIPKPTTGKANNLIFSSVVFVIFIIVIVSALGGGKRESKPKNASE
jgi:hypothetical protein